jgi:hypothetical protein
MPNSDLKKLLQISSIALIIAFLGLLLLVFSPISPLKGVIWDVGRSQRQAQQSMLDWLSRGEPPNGYIVYFGFWLSIVILLIISVLTWIIWFFFPPPDMNSQEQKRYEMALSASIRGNVVAVMLAVFFIALLCMAVILNDHTLFGLDPLIESIYGG